MVTFYYHKEVCLNADHNSLSGYLPKTKYHWLEEQLPMRPPALGPWLSDRHLPLHHPRIHLSIHRLPVKRMVVFPANSWTFLSSLFCWVGEYIIVVDMITEHYVAHV